MYRKVIERILVQGQLLRNKAFPNPFFRLPEGFINTYPVEKVSVTDNPVEKEHRIIAEHLD